MIYKRGKRRRVIVYAGRDPITGRKRQKSLSVDTRAEAKQAEARLITEVGAGQHRATSNRTVAELLDRWLDWRQSVRPISPTTVATYRGYIDLAILPTLGKLQLARLDAATLDAFYAHLRKLNGSVSFRAAVHGDRCQLRRPAPRHDPQQFRRTSERRPFGMTRLAGAIDGVIGVDPHRDTLAAAATDPVGGVLAQTSVRADAAGYRRLLDFARAQVPGRRCWAVEGAGSYGAGLTAFLQAHGERVVEVGRPKRPPRRTGPTTTPWTPSARHGRPSPTTIPWHPVAAAKGKRCGCCWPPATALVWPRSAPPTSSRP